MNYNIPVFEITIDGNEKLGIDEIGLVHSPAIEELWVAMAAEEEIKLAADDEKQIICGPILIPNKLIYRVHPETKVEYYIKFSEAVIRQIAERFFKQQKTINFLNVEHNKENGVQGTVVEAWVVEDSKVDKSALYGFEMPVGTFMLSTKIEDKKFWDEQIKTGKVRGYSIEGAMGMQLIEAMSQQELVVEPNSGETEDEFVSRCIGIEVGNGMDQEQAIAVCYSKWDNAKLNELKQYTLSAEEAEILIKEILLQESYRDYPEEASNNAKKALEWRDKYPNEIQGGTRIGWTRANQLADRRPISEETIARMASFARHAQNAEVDPDKKDKPWTDAGYVAWLIWGGTSGIEWAKRKLEQIRRRTKK